MGARVKLLALFIVAYLLSVAVTLVLTLTFEMLADRSLGNDRRFAIVASFLCPWAWLVVIPGAALVWATLLLVEFAHGVIDRKRKRR